MADVERGVFPTLPNQALHNGSPGSSSSLGRQASSVKAPNASIHNGDPGNGFMPLTKGASTVRGSNDSLKFDVSQAKMPQPPSVTQPGQGSVPFNPFMGPGGSTTSVRIPDMAKKAPIKGK